MAIGTTELVPRATPTPKRVAAVMDGRTLVDAEDALLDEPEVYYNPESPNLNFRIVPGQYPLPSFVQGRYICRTVRQREVVRRILGSKADRWRGDSSAIFDDMICDHPGCGLTTRNFNVFMDHRHYSGHMGG